MTDVLDDTTVTARLTVNGAAHQVEIEPRELLASVLRDRLGLTGTHIGCETTSCGACTVLLDGRSVKSCTMLAGPDGLHPVQEAFRQCHGLQCGFCTPGMVMAAVSVIGEGRARDEGSVRS